MWQLDQSSKSTVLTDDNKESIIDASTQQIKQQIAQINKRLSEEDKAIMIGGFHVGHMLSNVPWLNTNTW